MPRRCIHPQHSITSGIVAMRIVPSITYHYIISSLQCLSTRRLQSSVIQWVLPARQAQHPSRSQRSQQKLARGCAWLQHAVCPLHTLQHTPAVARVLDTYSLLPPVEHATVLAKRQTANGSSVICEGGRGCTACMCRRRPVVVNNAVLGTDQPEPALASSPGSTCRCNAKEPRRGRAT